MKKQVKESMTENTFLLMYEHMNSARRLFGGVLMQWIDQIAGIVAFRHARCEVLTAAVDNLVFQGPAYLNELVVMRGFVTYVGQTSIEVRVDTFVENSTGERRQINQAYLVMVALDENGKPTSVPGLQLTTEAEKWEWEMGQKRYDLRKQRRREHF